MTVIVSQTTLMDLDAGWWPKLSYGSLMLYDNYSYDYATLYRTQPNVRTCVDFLARNIAQLGLHVFRRVDDTDRVRLIDHPLALTLSNPLPPEFKVTKYRLIESLMSDMGVYFNAYWLKLRTAGGVGLLRVPPALMTVRGNLATTGYEVDLGDGVRRFAPNQVVHFRGYNPESAIVGLSPLETLRRVLAEEHAAGDYREHFWQNAARMSGIIERPREAPEWGEAARARFKQEFEALYAGGDNSGKTAILEEGMTWRPGTFNAQESEYLAGRKLTREECARAYHIPLPMVGILDHATFSNIKEQHKNLYQDALGPWLKMVEDDIELQLLPEFDDTAGVYVEFNIAEKLAGSFEEQTTALQSAVGRPWMTANEARARLNLPRSEQEDADELVTPLNVITGGQASPRDSAPPPEPAKGLLSKAADDALDSYRPDLRERHERKWSEALRKHYLRQEAAIISRVPPALEKSDVAGIWWDDERWNRELANDLLELNYMTATAWAKDMAGMVSADVSEDRMLPWLREHSEIQAQYINARTRNELERALREPEPLGAVKALFVLAATVWAVSEAVSAVTSAASFGANEGANAGGLRTKTWRVNSKNPRDAHAALNGTTVGIRETFPNGMRWPGDPVGGAENNANCQCSVVFGK